MHTCRRGRGGGQPPHTNHAHTIIKQGTRLHTPRCMLCAALASRTSLLRPTLWQTARPFMATSSAPFIDPALFKPTSIDEETKTATANAMEFARARPPDQALTAQEARERRAKEYMADCVQAFGHDGPPPQREDRTVTHPSTGISVGVSIFRPKVAPTALRGVYYHMHGGGWYMGGAKYQNDIRLCKLADSLSVAIVSVDYRLSPEAKFPEPVDDCVTGAAWLADQSEAEFGTSVLIIGGESAGGQLCAATMLRLRSALGLPSGAPLPYRAANLVYGIFDLAGTPSARAYGDRPLIFNTPQFDWCTALYLPEGADRRAPDVSPLYATAAELASLPPALFTIGTDDPLLDDSLFMAARWASAGNHAELAVYPGGAHGIGHFGPHAHTALGQRAHRRIESFMERYLR